MVIRGEGDGITIEEEVFFIIQASSREVCIIIGGSSRGVCIIIVGDSYRGEGITKK